MKNFIHFDASSLEEACKLLAEYDGCAKVNAGGQRFADRSESRYSAQVP